MNHAAPAGSPRIGDGAEWTVAPLTGSSRRPHARNNRELLLRNCDSCSRRKAVRPAPSGPAVASEIWVGAAAVWFAKNPRCDEDASCQVSLGCRATKLRRANQTECHRRSQG